MGYRIHIEKVEKGERTKIPKVRFKLSDFRTRTEALVFNEMLCLDGAISYEQFRRNKMKIEHKDKLFVCGFKHWNWS